MAAAVLLSWVLNFFGLFLFFTICFRVGICADHRVRLGYAGGSGGPQGRGLDWPVKRRPPQPLD